MNEYDRYWAMLCARHGWDWQDSPSEHEYELTDDEFKTLETLWWKEGLD